MLKAGWTRRQGDADAAYAAIQQKLTTARQRKDMLVNLRLDGDMDQITYKQQDERPSNELEAAQVELRQAESQFLDLEGVLAFAEKIVTSPARLWLESSVDQRQRLQMTFFPSGLSFDGEAFGTPVNHSFLSMLSMNSGDQSLMASPTGFEPVLSP